MDVNLTKDQIETLKQILDFAIIEYHEEEFVVEELKQILKKLEVTSHES